MDRGEAGRCALPRPHLSPGLVSQRVVEIQIREMAADVLTNIVRLNSLLSIALRNTTHRHCHRCSHGHLYLLVTLTPSQPVLFHEPFELLAQTDRKSTRLNYNH